MNIKPLELEQSVIKPPVQTFHSENPVNLGVPNLDSIEKRKINPRNNGLQKLLGKGKISKPNEVIIIYLRESGNAEVIVKESKRGFFAIGDKTYHENRDCIYTMLYDKKRLPLAIIPEWSLLPLGTKGWEDKDMQEKFAELQDHALKAIRNAELVRMGDKDQKKISPKAVIGGLIILIVIYAIWQGGFV